MEFRLLGPLDVFVGNRPISLRGAKKRAVLGLLLLRSEQPVPASHLMQRLWGDDPPATARSCLRNMTSILRQVLAEDPAQCRLTCDDFGYQLLVPPDSVDLHVVRRLGREARAAMRAGRPETAAPLFRQALDRWRGPALADVVSCRAAWPELAELDEEHLGLLEDRVDADLALGHQHQLIDELQDLVRMEPLRERRYAQLMRALYAVGRADEALAVYRQACGVLADEWGIDPGPELRRLYEAGDTRRPDGPAGRDHGAGTGTATEVSAVMFRLTRLTDPNGDPEQQARSLDACRLRIARHVELRGGRTVPTLGSTVLALFESEQHAERAVRAAFAARDDFAGAGDGDTPDAPGPRVTPELHVAVATGTVRTTRSGDGYARVALTGRVLDTCRHMAEVAPAGQILVARSTLSLSESLVAYREESGRHSRSSWLQQAVAV